MNAHFFSWYFSIWTEDQLCGMHEENYTFRENFRIESKIIQLDNGAKKKRLLYTRVV